MINAVDIGKKISEERDKLGISQTDLAQMVFVTPQAISKWENGQSIPSIDVLAILTNLFGISVDALLFPSNPEIEKLFSQHSREYVVDMVLSNKLEFDFEEHFHLFSNDERMMILQNHIVKHEDLNINSFWHLLSIYERIYLYDRLDGLEKHNLMLTIHEEKLFRRRKK